jgi:hypothetical protein
MSLHVLTYPYSKGSSSGVACHFVRSLRAPRLWGGCAQPLIIGVGRGGRVRSLTLGVGQGGHVLLECFMLDCWCPSPSGPFSGHLTAQLAQATYLEGGNP